MWSIIVLASMMIAGSFAANSNKVDICTSANQISSFGNLIGVNTQQLTSLTSQICGSPTSGNACGNANSQLANIMLCAMGAQSCGITPANQNQLISSFNSIMPSALQKVPQMSKYFNNQIVCAIVQQACCLSAGTNNVQLANVIAGVATGGQITNIISGLGGLIKF